MVKKRNHPGPGLWNKLIPAVKQMRQESTLAESILWAKLRDRQICSKKFRRQHAIDRFVVDFFCREAALIIEIDGSIHLDQIEQDRERQETLTLMGFRFLRFTNDQILNQMDFVLHQIQKAVEEKGFISKNDSPSPVSG